MYRDLSQPIESGMPTYPGDPDVDLSPAATHGADGYAVTGVRLGSHTGTHIDAPLHTEPDGEPLDERPVAEYVFEARLVDVSPCDPRESIGPEAFPDGIGADEAGGDGIGANGAAGDGIGADDAVDLLVVDTGWAERWGDPSYRDHPYLSPGFVDRCVDAGVGVAVDALNPDPTPSADDRERGADEPDGFPAHGALLGADLPILENLTNLDGLPERFRLYAFPLPIADADGAPIRAVAEH